MTQQDDGKVKQAASMMRSVGCEATERIREQGRGYLPEALLTLQRAITQAKAIDPAELKSMKLEWSWTSPDIVDWTVTVERHKWVCEPVIGEGLCQDADDAPSPSAGEDAPDWRCG